MTAGHPNLHAADAATRRERNQAAGLCINETQDGTHGLATHGVRCARCHLVKKHGAVRARETFEWNHFKPVRPELGTIEPVERAKRGPKPRSLTLKNPLPVKAAARKPINTCAVCTEIAPTRPTDLDDNGILYEVCARCNGEHPRAGGYAFDEGARPNPTGVDRAIGHRRTGMRGVG